MGMHRGGCDDSTSQIAAKSLRSDSIEHGQWIAFSQIAHLHSRTTSKTREDHSPLEPYSGEAVYANFLRNGDKGVRRLPARRRPTWRRFMSDRNANAVLAGARMVGVNLMVGDIDKSAAFYTQLLGAAPVSDAKSGPAFDVGRCVLWLKARSGPAPAARDRTAMMTFLVKDINKASAALRSGGIEVGDIFRYEVGATADFRDPDGHSLALYEPSTDALGWPSGTMLTSIANERLAPALVYIFLFVPDAGAAYSFYHQELGLPYLEREACRRGSIVHEQGVVKYDVGSLMLTTHLAEGPDDSELGKQVRNEHILSELVPVFAADEFRSVSAALKQWNIGAILRGQAPTRELVFTDRFGRPLLVRETSPALGQPSEVA
jgi:catechol 2,3-dioxygenase-like lactoylglutathione lyase family enzyme